jgi:hypothetical protein
MLKIYNSLDEVPEALRGEYKMVGGKAVPDLSEDHPVLVNNRTLLNEKTAAETRASGLETKVTKLEGDVESAKASGLPRGHRAVTVAEAELLDKVKAHGTSDEVVIKLTEHKNLKEETEQRKRQDQLREVAKELSYEPEAFIRLQNLPEFEIREKDGKKTVIAKVKDSAGVITEKPAHEFIEGSADIAPFLPALKASTGSIKVGEQRRDPGKSATNDYDKIREDAKKRAEKKDTSIPLSGRQGLRVIGGERAA